MGAGQRLGAQLPEGGDWDLRSGDRVGSCGVQRLYLSLPL